MALMLQNIPTHVIAGPLGAGKTSLIKHLRMPRYRFHRVMVVMVMADGDHVRGQLILWILIKVPVRIRQQRCSAFQRHCEH